MKLFLDANVVIDLINGRQPQVRERFVDALSAGDALATSSLVAQEVLFGAAISARRAFQQMVAESHIAQLNVCDFDLEDARAAATLRAELRRRGTPIGNSDVLIATQALRRDCKMVTANTREFKRVPDLDVIDWRAATESP